MGFLFHVRPQKEGPNRAKQLLSCAHESAAAVAEYDRLLLAFHVLARRRRDLSVTERPPRTTKCGAPFSMRQTPSALVSGDKIYTHTAAALLEVVPNFRRRLVR